MTNFDDLLKVIPIFSSFCFTISFNSLSKFNVLGILVIPGKLIRYIFCVVFICTFQQKVLRQGRSLINSDNGLSPPVQIEDNLCKLNGGER